MLPCTCRTSWWECQLWEAGSPPDKVPSASTEQPTFRQGLRTVREVAGEGVPEAL